MRGVKALFAIVVIVVVLAGGAAVALRVARERFSPPENIKTNIVSVASPGGFYVYAARAGSHVLLFDASADPAGHPVDAALGGLGASRGDVSDIFLTHGHMDHVAAAALFDKARIHLGAGDLPLAERKVDPEALAGKIVSKIIPAPPFTPGDLLSGQGGVAVGDGQTVKTFPMPGHTAGSYAFLYDGVLFVGDTMVFKQGQLEPGYAIFDAHPTETRAAIRALKPMLASETVDIVCTGHGGCTPKGLGRPLLDDLIGRLGS